MSMITEQVEQLREEADFIIETIDQEYPTTIGVAKIMKRAADTIEQLAAKVRKENGFIFPENPTNGDMIKAIFPNAEFDNAKPFTDGRWETMNLDTENRTRATYKPTQLRTYADWWNSPYKRGETE